jgi:SET domain-containing protein
MPLLKLVYISKSNIHGCGVFAAQPIKKGETIYSANKLESKDYVFGRLSKHRQEWVKKYGWQSIRSKKWMWCEGEWSYANHSDSPNVDDTGDFLSVAKRNIDIGEELTVDYKSFMENWRDHMPTAEICGCGSGFICLYERGGKSWCVRCHLRGVDKGLPPHLRSYNG